MPAYTKIAYFRSGVIPVKYRRVTCIKKGGVKFQIRGNPYWNLVLVYNVGGAGDVTGVQVKGSSTGWITMSRNWGQNWMTGVVLTGQTLSFKVTVSDGTSIQFDDVVPSNWKFEQFFDGKKNF